MGLRKEDGRCLERRNAKEGLEEKVEMQAMAMDELEKS